MVSLLDDATVLEDENAVGHAGRAQSVADQQRGAAGEQFAELPVHLGFGHGI